MKRNERNVKKLKIWMIENDLREKDIVKDTGEEQTYVNKTLNGHKHNRVVLQYLIDKGFPKKHLALPADMKEAA